MDRDFWEEFLNVYRMYPCLWDTKNKDYMNKQQKDLAYAELLSKCKERFPGATKEFVTKKIHGFRCSFRRELNKVIRSMERGAYTGEVYVPTLWYYNTLSFIADAEMPKDGVSACDGSSQEEDTISETPDYMENTPYSPEVIAPLPPQNNTSAFRYPDIKTPTRFKRRFAMSANSTMKRYCTGGPHSAAKFFKELDDHEITGFKYARDLKNLNEEQKIYFEKLVSDLLFYAKRGELSDATSINLGIPNPLIHECKFTPMDN